MNRIRLGLLAVFSLLAGLSTAQATLLGVSITTNAATISYINTSALSIRYIASNQMYSLDASPSSITFPGESTVSVLSPRTLKIRAQVNNAGVLVGGVAGPDLVISGVCGRVVGSVTNIYTGLLLEAEINAFGFGYADSGTIIDNYDMRFTVTGGLLADDFNCDTLGVQVTSENSTFTNSSFAVNFNGRSKGSVGVEDRTAPLCYCPADRMVDATDEDAGQIGAFVTYEPATVTDSCLPAPQYSYNPPSGSFFVLPAGVMSTNYPVVVIGVDQAGNTCTCSFTVTVQAVPPPPDEEPPVIDPCTFAAAYCNDADQCSTTLTLPIPAVTDNDAVANVTITAMDENGLVIPLTFPGNGTFVGEFPVIKAGGSNLVTVVATDLSGNSANRICPVLVNDCEAPAILCENYTIVATNCVTEVDNDDDDDRGCRENDHNWRRRRCHRHYNWHNWCDRGDDDSGDVVRKAVVSLPPVSDNCDDEVFVQSNPPVGTPLGAGQHVIQVTAVDNAGNTNTCSYTVTVLPGLQVKFRSEIDDDNQADNVETDRDIRNRFTPNCTVPHKVTLHDICTGEDVTRQLRGLVTVKLDVTLRKQLLADSILVREIDENPSDLGDTGTLMYPIDGMYFYLLRTRGYEANTVCDDRFFRSDVKVYYNTNPEVVVGREDATLESRR